jgi:hypothetical protein
VLVTSIKAPAWVVRLGEPRAPLGVISMLLSRSPADLGLACVSFSTTVSVPAPGVISALAAHASLQPPVTLKKNGVAFATPPAASKTLAVTAPAANDRNFRIKPPGLASKSEQDDAIHEASCVPSLPLRACKWLT